MLDQLGKIYEEAKTTIATLENADEIKVLEDIRIQILGKNGTVSKVMSEMRTLSNDMKKEVGQKVNIIKKDVAILIDDKMTELEEKKLEQELKDEAVDVTITANKPIVPLDFHPLNQVLRDIEGFFRTMGYAKVSGPEIETDYYNFEAVNLPKNHPARDMQDTFYLNPEELLRTHTTGVQARTLEKAQEADFPIKIISPGKVYRRDDDDATHSHQFLQVEGLYIGENVSMSDLKGTLQAMVDFLFGEGRNIRLRPSYFSFVEPGVEVDVTCASCNGAGCSVCKQTGYIEILGAGLVHPSLLDHANIDSKKYSGFAFGVGADRISMLKYGVEDIRHFYTNDVRFLEQFSRKK